MGSRQNLQQADPKQTPVTPPLNSNPQKPTATPKPRPPVAIIGLALAFIIPPVGLVVSIVARNKIYKQQLGGKWLSISGILIGAVWAIPFVFFAWMSFTTGYLSLNRAERDIRPIASQITRLGGHKICDNGDPGFGADNNSPWYEVYYLIPNNQSLTPQVNDIANRHGYQLQQNTDFITALKNGGESDEQYSPTSDYLVGYNGSKKLTVTVYKQTGVPIHCVDGYGNITQTGSTNAILDLSIDLPAN